MKKIPLDKIKAAETIISIVGIQWGVTPRTIIGNDRGSPRDAEARALAMLFINVDLEIPTTKTGMIFSRRDPSTVAKATAKIKRRCLSDDSFRTDFIQLRSYIHSRLKARNLSHTVRPEIFHPVRDETPEPTTL